MRITLISGVLLLLSSCGGGRVEDPAVEEVEEVTEVKAVEEPTGTRYIMTLRAYEVDGGRYVLSDGMGTILTDGGFTFIDGSDYEVSFNENSGEVLEVNGTGTITDDEAIDALKDGVLMDEVKDYGMGLLK